MASAEKIALFGAFLRNKKIIDDHMASGHSGSSKDLPPAVVYADDHPPAVTYERPTMAFMQHSVQDANVMDFVATSGGAETFPTKFASLAQFAPRYGRYVGALPQSNVPVFDIGVQAWPTVGVAADPATRAVKKREANPMKGNKIQHVTLKQEVAAAQAAHTVELFKRQEAGRNRMMDLFDSVKPMPLAPEVDERGYGVSSAPAGAASSSSTASDRSDAKFLRDFALRQAAKSEPRSADLECGSTGVYCGTVCGWVIGAI
jgi:hypothetical protein